MYDGGYYLLSDEFVHAGLNKHTAELKQPFSPETLDAVNIIQDTPWAINKTILATAFQADEAGAGIADVPPAELAPLPRVPDALWETMSRDEKLAHKARLSEIHEANATQKGRRYGFLMKRDMARDLADEPAIWFPHTVDFRGRIYPSVADLSPQGDDMGKALLQFARGVPLGDTGLTWLCVRAATCYGKEGGRDLDKLPMDERAQWVADNLPRLREAAEAPIDGTRWWTEAEEPWSFLATCYEIVGAIDSDSPDAFLSHLPVPLDGTCNGLQHLAAMGRDEIGARATNVLPSDERRDIYADVAALVQQAVTADAGKGVREAELWLGHGQVTRKVVKRAVMTTPYGVTERGMVRQFLTDKYTKDILKAMGLERSAAAEYIKTKVMEALSEIIVSAKQIMAWLQAIADALAEHGKPFTWITPTGNTIQQAYWDLVEARVQTLGGTISIYREERAAGLRRRKQRLAAAPNVIHSFDGAHLVRTVNACSRLGVNDFAMIHDSFGTHAAHTDYLAHTLREEFVKIYRTNWLQEIEDYVRCYAGDTKIPPWTEYVTLGNLEIEQVMQADFFFA